MDYEKKYKEALEKLQEALAPKNGCEISGLTRACIEEIFPELAESENEKIRKEMIGIIRNAYWTSNRDRFNKLVAWLEKQKSVEEIVERCKNSWYNEGKIAGMAEGLSDDEKYQQGWKDAIEKQVPVNKDKVAKGVKRGVATSLINYIDANSKGMCLSNMECEDIEDAIVNGKWYKVYGYMKKKLEKQGEKPQGKTAIEAVKEEKVDNANKVEPKFKIKLAGREYNVLEIKEIAGVMYYGIEDEPNHIDYVLPENCEIISGYGVKEKGNQYPTKSAIFSEQKPNWSEEDEKRIKKVMHIISCDGRIDNKECKSMLDWLESLKDRYTWKPSNIQMECLYDAINHYHINGYPASKLSELYEQMSKIYKL